MFEEYEKQFPAKYGDSRPLMERLFSSKPQPGLGMEVKKAAPALYKALQGYAREAGFLGESPAERHRRLAEVKPATAPKLLDEDEQIARSSFSEDEIDRILANQGAGSPDNLVAMRKGSEALKAYYIKLAAYSYGKASNRPTKPTPDAKPAAEQGETFALAPELCKTFNVKEGTFVTLEQFADLSVKNHAARKAEADKAVAEGAAVTK